MKLDRFNPANIRVRNHGSGGSGFPGGGGGKLGCGSIVIVLIAALVFGVDPGQMLGTLEGMQQQTAPAGEQREAAGASAEQVCGQNNYAMESCNALSSLNQTWQPLFTKAKLGFEQPTLNFYQGGTRSGCGLPFFRSDISLSATSRDSSECAWIPIGTTMASRLFSNFWKKLRVAS